MAIKVNEENVNQFISIFNTEIEKLADWVNDKIPNDSALRNPAFKRVLDYLSAWVEGKANKISNPFISAIVEKSSDFMEFVSDRLDGKGGGNSEKKQKSGSASSKAAENVKTAFLAKVAERLEKAPDMKTEAEKIKEELKLLDEILSGTQKTQESVPSEDGERVKKEFGDFLEDLKSVLNKLNIKENLKTANDHTNDFFLKLRSLGGFKRSKKRQEEFDLAFHEMERRDASQEQEETNN